jgi:hypothetical protein
MSTSYDTTRRPARISEISLCDCAVSAAIRRYVAGAQDTTVREQDRGVADGVRLMLDDLAWQKRL